MSSTTAPGNDRLNHRYTNVALSAIAVLLGVIALGQGQGGASTALAQPSSGEDGLVSAAEQRKVMISELRQLNTRVEHLDTAMARAINVKVLEMPPVQMMDKVEPRKPMAPTSGRRN